MTTATQTRQVLLLLQVRGNQGLTPLEALNRVGCFRLAARIKDLRNDGFQIDTVIETTPAGKRIARYVLREPTRQEVLGLST